MPADAALYLDAAGQTHGPADGAPRIVSLSPVLTELCLELELGPSLVGRTEACAKQLDGLAGVASVGRLDALKYDRIAELEPSHILLNLDDLSQADIEKLRGAGGERVCIRPCAPNDNFDLFRMLGGIFGVASAADTLSRRFEAALARIKMAMREKPLLRALYLVDRDPWRAAAGGSYIAGLLEIAGFAVIGSSENIEVSDAATPKRYPAVELGEGLLKSVDAILLDGGGGKFRRSDLKRFSEAHGIDRAKLHYLETSVADWYGARAITAMDDLMALRRSVDGPDAA